MKMKSTVAGTYRRKKKMKGKKRNQRNGMQKKAAMDSVAKSMNKGFGYGA
jgi:hypothetical protein